MSQENEVIKSNSAQMNSKLPWKITDKMLDDFDIDSETDYKNSWK